MKPFGELCPICGTHCHQPGKFEGNTCGQLAERLYQCIMDSWQTDELGDCQGFGWYGLLLAPFGDDTPSYIVSEDSRGSFGYTEYTTERKARADWRKLEKEYEQWCCDCEDEMEVD